MLNFKLSFCLFCLIEVLCIFPCAGNSNVKSCVETDKQALPKLKDGLIDEGNILSSWRREVDCCKWRGISCNNLTGHVTQLNLQASDHSTKLKGTINSSLCELQHLTLLDLSFNDFEGQMIPKCLGSLGHLTELKLRKANLISTIPSELQNLSNLQILDLGDNYNMISNSLDWISHLSSLRYLDLSRVDLSRAIDWQPSISKTPSLIELHLNKSQLPEVNPKPFSHMNFSTHLKVLNLGRNQLSSLTLSWVFNYSKVLVHLDLSYNSLQHIAPDAFINMTSLKHFDLSNNKLEISTIKFVCDLCQLNGLLLSSNNLSGQLSHWIHHQSCCVQNRIEELDLSQNPFIRGPFPNFSAYSSLVTLNLRNTSLCGSISQVIPQAFGSLHSLRHLDLSYNNLSGSLSESTQLSSLETLDLSHNKFNGTLPSTLGQLSSLNKLILSSNNLSWVINESHLSTLSNLKVLDVSRNSISFNFSSNWVPSFQLYHLSASSCNLGIKFPSWLKYQKRLELLNISYVGILDSIPEWFWDSSPGLKYLDLSYNKIHGAFPSITRQQGLRFLDMSNNLLSGRLPDYWGYFDDLEVLNLAKNTLSGRIPNSFGTLNRIKTIHLNGNNFYGEMPSFMHSPQLQFIDFAQNKLSGNIPEWIGNNLPNLIVLSLRANKLQGSIPANVCKLEHLQILDLSQNEITGMVPHCLDNLFAMSGAFTMRSISYSTEDHDGETINPFFIDSATLRSKGRVVTYEEILGFVTTIDLSCNHLQGEIPDSITKLSALHFLNLSSNNLTGFIPGNIGEIKMLEALDLSTNSLSGRIPSSLSSLLCLSVLNLSFNSLSGEIPLGVQLQSLDSSSYMGNQGLCGPPLTRECPRDHASSDNSDPDNQLIGLGFYISMFFGFLIGFWGVCGTLILKTSWRQSYFQFLSDMNDWIYVHAFLFMTRMKTRFQEHQVLEGANC